MSALPKILLDLDGVVVNFHQKLIDVYNQRYPESKKLTVNDIDCEIETLGPDLAHKLIGIFNEKDWFIDLEPLSNSIRTVLSFADLGYDVTVCTAPARDLDGIINPGCASEKYIWMQKYLPLWANNMIITKHKEVVRTDIIIDDTGYNIINWCRENPDGVGYLIDQPWNKRFNNYPTNSTRGTLEGVTTFIDKFWCRKRGKFIYRLDELNQG